MLKTSSSTDIVAAIRGARNGRKNVLGSDIAHFDVIDATEVLEEAYELVEDGHITEHNFREFTFSNVVQLYSGMNPSFFAGTVVEDAAQAEFAKYQGAK